MANNGNRSGYGPSIPLCRLFERVSKNGNYYLTGRLGAAKIAILKSSETTEDGTPIWNVLLQEGTPPKAKAESAESEPQRVRTEPDPEYAARRDYQRPSPSMNDEIPF
jgi:hypothetical protein